MNTPTGSITINGPRLFNLLIESLETQCFIAKDENKPGRFAICRKLQQELTLMQQNNITEKEMHIYAIEILGSSAEQFMHILSGDRGKKRDIDMLIDFVFSDQLDCLYENAHNRQTINEYVRMPDHVIEKKFAQIFSTTN